MKKALISALLAMTAAGCNGDAKKDEAGSLLTNDRMETSIPGLFAAGDVRATPFRQLITAVSDGAVAAHSASQYIDEIRGEAYR